MNRILYLFLLAVMAMSLASCNDDGEYVEHNGTICHSYWTFSFGTVYNELPQVDAASFKTIKGWLGCDKSHVYYEDRLIPGADPASIKVVKNPVTRDRRDYYYKWVPLRVSHPDALVILYQSDMSFWAKDARRAYYDSIPIDTADVRSFEVKTWNVAVDKNHVYRFGKILKDADPATYDEQWASDYSRDKSHIWYLGDMVEDVDYATFVVDKDGAHDKRGHFLRGKRVSDEEWQEFVSNDSP